MAPMRAANTTVVVIASVATKPFPTVAATFNDMKAPTKLSSEAIATARRGPIARVEIDVATTFAVS